MRSSSSATEDCKATVASTTRRSAEARARREHAGDDAGSGVAAGVVAVAYSGGRDSTALLHAAVHASCELGLRAVALHVHHGLHPQADDWLSHCERVCKRWAARGLPLAFASQRLEGPPPRGASVEAWARQGRYRALAGMAQAAGASLVLLAQHRRDQAETFILQALRGAGVAGLAAMPRVAERDGLVWARPWLSLPRESIEAYVRRHRLAYIDDSSNADPRWARNRLRELVWPVLVRAFPSAESALTNSAAWAAHARTLLDEIGRQDLDALAPAGALDVTAWRSMSSARRRNALRAWLACFVVPPASLVERLMRELEHARPATWPLDAMRELRLYRGSLRVAARPPSSPERPSAMLRIEGSGDYRVAGWQGRIVVRPASSGGLPAALLPLLQAQARRGGEKFQLAAAAIPRSLAKQFQALGVAARDRTGPLFFAGERLVFVPGLGIDARARAADGEPQFDLAWIPHDAEPERIDEIEGPAP